MKLPNTGLLGLNTQLISDILARDLTFVAVTKNQPVQTIKELINLGVKHIGENKVQEFEEKYEKVKEFLAKSNIKDVKFHFIGHLQSNKAAKVVGMFDVIHSIDSEKIAERVNTTAFEINKKMDVMIQVNIGREKQKYGIMPDKVEEFYNKIKHFEKENINIIGLMCIAPDVGEDSRKYFKQMKELKEKLNLPELSMGMTNDYWIAIEEGSTMVRLGRVLYKKIDSCCG